jgi:hypothetical protein
MKITTTSGTEIEVSSETKVVYVGATKVNRGLIRWIIIAVLFWPALLLWFVVGDAAHKFQINNEIYTVDQWNYERLKEGIKQ